MFSSFIMLAHGQQCNMCSTVAQDRSHGTLSLEKSDIFGFEQIDPVNPNEKRYSLQLFPQ